MSRSRRFLHRYAVLTATFVFLLLIAGGLVTSTDSGLAVPDWPLSYGTWFPPMVGGILYEHGHRMIAAVVGIMILILAGWLWTVEPRRWVRLLGYCALAAVLVQALLGGLTVLLLLPPTVSIAHACVGQTVFCLVVCLARSTAPHWSEAPVRIQDPGHPPLRALALAVALLAVLQLFLGAIIRHTGAGLTLHVAGAMTVVLMAGWLAWRVRRFKHRDPHWSSHVKRLLGLLLTQLVVGLLVFTHRGAIGLRTAHVIIGALILAHAIVLAWDLLRSTTSAVSVPTARSLSPQVS